MYIPIGVNSDPIAHGTYYIYIYEYMHTLAYTYYIHTHNIILLHLLNV